jgi:hypothetical protein
MNYEEIEVTFITGITEKHIIVYDEESIPKSFLAEETNPEYVAFLEKLKTKDVE